MDYQPLFLKYRPQTLGELVGQDSVKETLKNAIENNKLVHAYLFTGPRGTGKTSSARIFAKSLNCLGDPDSPEAKSGPTIEPCGKCASCLGIANSTSLDVIEIDAASHGHVEDARLLIEKVNLASIAGNYKIYIIDEVHMLSTAAFNALLKIFEEPPEKVIFILATTEEDKVLPTIVSRCQKFSFKHIALNDAIKRLSHVAAEEKINIDDAALELIAKRADGGMRDALSLLDQLSAFASADTITRDRVLDLVGGVSTDDLDALTKAVLEREAKTALEVLDKLSRAGKEAISISKEFANYLLELLEAGDHGFENFELVQMIDALSELESKMKQSTQAKNLLMAAILKLCHRQDILIVKDLMKRIEALEKGAPPAQSNRQANMAAYKPAAGSAQAKPTNASLPATPKQATSSNVEDKPANTASAYIDSKKQSLSQEPSANGPDFLDYLSPACKGIYMSSKSQFAGINDGVAVIQIPAKFKFLKSKLEIKADEIASAIGKANKVDITKLQIDEVEGDMPEANPYQAKEQPSPAPKPVKPAIDAGLTGKVAAKVQESQKENTATKQTAFVKDRRPSPETQSESPALEEARLPKVKSHKLEEAMKMAKDTFNAKVID